MKKLINVAILIVAIILLENCKKAIDNPDGPTARTGEDQVAFVGELVALDGSASTDPAGATLTYKWSFSSKPAGSNANLLNAGTAKPEFSPDIIGEYIAVLTVSNGKAEGSKNTKITAGGAPFLMELINHVSMEYHKDNGSNSPGDAGYQFTVSKDVKVTHLVAYMPNPGTYMVTIWNPQSTGVIYQAEVEQKAIGSIGSVKVTPNPIELAKDKKYVISVYYGGNPIYSLNKIDQSNYLPWVNQIVTVEGARYSLGTNMKPTYPAVAFQELYRLRGFATFAYVEK